MQQEHDNWKLVGEVSPEILDLVDYAAVLTIDFPGVTDNVCRILSSEVNTLQISTQLIELRRQAEARRVYAFETVRPEKISPWQSISTPMQPDKQKTTNFKYDNEEENLREIVRGTGTLCLALVGALNVYRYLKNGELIPTSDASQQESIFLIGAGVGLRIIGRKKN